MSISLSTSRQTRLPLQLFDVCAVADLYTNLGLTSRLLLRIFDASTSNFHSCFGNFSHAFGPLRLLLHCSVLGPAASDVTWRSCEIIILFRSFKRQVRQIESRQLAISFSFGFAPQQSARAFVEVATSHQTEVCKVEVNAVTPSSSLVRNVAFKFYRNLFAARCMLFAFFIFQRVNIQHCQYLALNTNRRLPLMCINCISTLMLWLLVSRLTAHVYVTRDMCRDGGWPMGKEGGL